MAGILFASDNNGDHYRSEDGSSIWTVPRGQPSTSVIPGSVTNLGPPAASPPVSPTPPTYTPPTPAPVAPTPTPVTPTPVTPAPVTPTTPAPATASPIDFGALVHPTATPTPTQTPTPTPTPAPATGGLNLPALVGQPTSGAVQTPALPTLPPTTVTPPTLPTTPAGPTAPAAGTARLGQDAMSKLAPIYLRDNPGATLAGDGFNHWAGALAQRFGVGSAEDIPADFESKLSPTAGVAKPPSLSVSGGNYDVQEAGNQTGAYNSTGNTAQASNSLQQQTSAEHNQQQQTGVTDQTSTGTQTSTGATTGATNETQSGQQATTGTTAGQTNVTTPFDIQSLVAGQLPATAASDSSRNAFLQDFMKTGGTGFNSQVDQAIRGSLTGPQVTGSGESARARMAGYGAAQVARNNAGERLNAAAQLGGPTGLTTAAGQLAPLYGTSTSGATTGTSATSGTSAGTTAQNTAGATTNAGATHGITNSTSVGDLTKAAQNLDFQSLVGQENQSGSATGSSASAGAGVVPEGQPVKTGGCVVCTAYVERGEADASKVRRAVLWKVKQKKYALAIDGYMVYGPQLARWVLKSPRFARLFRPLALSILSYEIHLSQPTGTRWRLIPCITHALFDLLSRPVGLWARWTKRNTGVRCPMVRDLLKRQNLEFPL